MELYSHPLYKEDISYVTNLDLPWEKLKDKTVLIAGATGAFGTFLVDVLMKKNKNGLNCKVICLGRDKKRGLQHFIRYKDNDFFTFYECDLSKTDSTINFNDTVDFVFHLACNANPKSYATDPIGTIMSNVIGTHSLLMYAKSHGNGRFVFASSSEIYGENRGDVELIDERYCGYIDCNTLRACYSEGKRCSESLCQAFISQENMDIVLPRFNRAYGPTIKTGDSKVVSQFIANAINHEDIVLKSTGEQYFSFIYIADVISGLLAVALRGHCGEAYNISNENSDIRLKDLASMVAKIANVPVKFELPDKVEAAGYSKATDARLDSSKTRKELGWIPHYNLQEGLSRTLEILKKG